MLKIKTISAILLLQSLFNNIAFCKLPIFVGPIVNETVVAGLDVTLRCLVRDLGDYRVAWVKADTKAIQAIHNHVIIHNPRISVSHDQRFLWNLHIARVVEEDGGVYMCQLNTDPMRSQIGCLEVRVPPEFVFEDTSGDVIIPEGGDMTLTCRARGHPLPDVYWKREDGGNITIRHPSGKNYEVSTFSGEVLTLYQINRFEMGAFLCTASNSVPPSISKRILVHIHFHPVIRVRLQLVGAHLGQEVILQCVVEAFPKTENYWIRNTGEKITSSTKHEVIFTPRSLFEVRMSLKITNFHHDDVGSYKCRAENSMGRVESSIRVYEMAFYDDEDAFDYGSAQREISEHSPSIATKPAFAYPTETSKIKSIGYNFNEVPKSSIRNRSTFWKIDDSTNDGDNRIKPTNIMIIMFLAASILHIYVNH